MARITVEDCVKKIDRFTLVIVSAQRVREIEGGAPLHVPRENDKFPVVALREVAQGSLDFQKLQTAFMRTFQKHRVDEDLGEDLLDEDPISESDNMENILLEPSFDEVEDDEIFTENESEPEKLISE